MLACARHLGHCRRLSSISNPWSTSSGARISTSVACRQQETLKEDDTEDQKLAPVDVNGTRSIPFESWVENEGKPFQHTKPRNWLGGDVPFPLNPSFKPPTPVSDALKSHIYDQYMANPSMNGVRSLATRYGMSIKRVDAILRLKGLEEHWFKEGKTSQTGFVAGMEFLLGVEKNPRLTVAATLGSDTTASDLQDEAEGADRLRDRYVRSFWESVPEDKQEPIMPDVLEHAQRAGKNWTKIAEDAKSDERILGTRKDNPPKTQFLPSGSTPGRPITQFIDVGGKFVDVKEYTRRSKESERRRKVKGKNSTCKKPTVVGGKPKHVRT